MSCRHETNLPDARASGVARGPLMGRWRGGAVMMSIAAMIWVHAVAGLGAENSVYEQNMVKGAFLAKFALFVEWPRSAFADAAAPVTIGVIGEDPFGPQYEAALSKEMANGRPFQVKRFKDPAEIDGCQILFVSHSEGERLPEILAAVGSRPILVVGDQERFAHRGGMVNFVKEGGKLRFEVNIEAAQGNGLKMSAKLMQVARPVKTETTKGGA